MSRKIKMYVSKISIVSANEVSTDLRKRVRIAMSSIIFSDIKFENIVDRDSNAMDVYRVLGGSKELSKDNRYLSGFLLKESSLITGKINEETQIKYEERSDNDEGIRFTIDLSEGIVVYNKKLYFGTAQFNKALSYILNTGINNLGITNIDLNIENAKDNFNVSNLKENLEVLGQIEELKIKVDLLEEAKNHSFIENPEITSHTRTYTSNYATGINFNSSLEKELNDVISLHSEIEKINTLEKINIGSVKINGRTVIGKSFGTSENITYSVDEKFSEKLHFIDKSKDIIEDHIKTFY